MSLLRSPLRPPSVLSDAAVERYVASMRASIQPDPAYRRRLRGHVLNEYVAAREGIGTGRLAREMGKLGRAVLYASVALALSVTGAMAMSQQAVPGDPFYTLKRQIEELRMQVLPAHLHDELAADELTQRIVELDRLAEAGDPDAIARQAAAVEAAYEEVVALGGDTEQVHDRLTVAGALLDNLPDEARETVADVIDDLPGVGLGDNAGTPGQGRDHGGVPPGHSQGGGPGDAPGQSEETPEPTEKPKPTKPPEPTKPPQAGQPAEPTKPPQAGQPAQPTHPPHANNATPTPSPTPKP